MGQNPSWASCRIWVKSAALNFQIFMLETSVGHPIG
jgi:hypothetical protein